MERLTEEYSAEKRLIKGICAIARELDMDVELVEKDLWVLAKNELIEKFIEIKEIRLKEENLRLVDLLFN